MFTIKYFMDRNGRIPLKEYLKELNAKAATGKRARVLLKKILAYIELLRKFGTHLGEPMVKHVVGELWELRPLDKRVFFFCLNGGVLVLLHHYEKKDAEDAPS